MKARLEVTLSTFLMAKKRGEEKENVLNESLMLGLNERDKGVILRARRIKSGDTSAEPLEKLDFG